jgi:hypothetical protein
MTTARMTVSCPVCKQSVRYMPYLTTKPTVIGGPRYCTYCGHDGVGVTQDHALDTDEVLAESYDMTVQRFRKVYELWLLIAADKTFSQFVAEVNRAALAKRTNS